MRMLVTGSTGYIGARLVAALLAAGHHVVATARSPHRLRQFDFAGSAELAALDADDERSCAAALDTGIDTAYYLVHAIGSDDYAATDRRPGRRLRAGGAGRGGPAGGVPRRAGPSR